MASIVAANPANLPDQANGQQGSG